MIQPGDADAERKSLRGERAFADPENCEDDQSKEAERHRGRLWRADERADGERSLVERIRRTDPEFIDEVDFIAKDRALGGELDGRQNNGH
jgi:hypothetical protein